MACIDKTYTNNYEEYLEVVNWAKDHKFTCPNGMIVDPSKYIYEIEEEYFINEKKIPIMNTSQVVDYFLIKYCPIKLVQDRMREVYNEDYINSVLNGTSEFDTFVRPETGSKVKLIEGKYNKILKARCHNNKRTTWVNIDVKYGDHYLWYNDHYDTFLLPYELGTVTATFVHLRCKSIKAVVRRIKKLNLPKGCIVIVQGRYVGETWKFRIS